MTHDSVIMFVIADLTDISITFTVIFFSHRYSFIVGIVLINDVFTDIKAIDVSLKIALVFIVIAFVEASVSLTISIIRSEKILQYERVCNDFNFHQFRLCRDHCLCHLYYYRKRLGYVQYLLSLCVIVNR